MVDRLRSMPTDAHEFHARKPELTSLSFPQRDTLAGKRLYGAANFVQNGAQSLELLLLPPNGEPMDYCILNRRLNESTEMLVVRAASTRAHLQKTGEAFGLTHSVDSKNFSLTELGFQVRRVWYKTPFSLSQQCQRA